MKPMMTIMAMAMTMVIMDTMLAMMMMAVMMTTMTMMSKMKNIMTMLMLMMTIMVMMMLMMIVDMPSWYYDIHKKCKACNEARIIEIDAAFGNAPQMGALLVFSFKKMIFSYFWAWAINDGYPGCI